MNTRYIKITIAALAIMGTAVAFAGIPALRQHFVASPEREAPAAVNAVNEGDRKQQEAILKEMSTVLHAIDTLSALTFSGSIHVNDLADSTNSSATSFVYSRQGKEGYYHIADNEIISLKNLSIVIAHDAKKIFVAAPKPAQSPMSMPMPAEIQLLMQEGYTMSRSVSAGITTIALLNSKHASCREYRLSYDSTGSIKKVNMRLSDPGDMSDLQKDKLISVRIDSWSSVTVRRELLKAERYVVKQNGVYIPAPAYGDYDLISDL